MHVELVIKKGDVAGDISSFKPKTLLILSISEVGEEILRSKTVFGKNIVFNILLLLGSKYK